MGKNREREKLDFWLRLVAQNDQIIPKWRGALDGYMPDHVEQVKEAFAAFPGLDPEDPRDWKLLVFFLADAFFGRSVHRMVTLQDESERRAAIFDKVERNLSRREPHSDGALAGHLITNNPLFHGEDRDTLRKKIGERRRRREQALKARPKAVDAFGNDLAK